MSRNRISIPALAAATLICLLSLATGVFEAGSTVIDPINGHILTVDIASEQGTHTRVRYHDRSPSGHILYEDVPSSIDDIIDDAPTIAINPNGGAVVIWSRHDGSDFELVLARREAGMWFDHLYLTSNSSYDTEARLLIDSSEKAHVLRWGNGAGSPLTLQSFDILNGEPVSPPVDPFQPHRRRTNRYDVDTFDGAGGVDEPGIPAFSGGVLASAFPCLSNPAAGADHGVVMSCGQPAAYQLSACQLVVGIPSTGNTWRQIKSNLSSADLSSTSVHQIVQTIADVNLCY